jgi:hypothetical protein
MRERRAELLVVLTATLIAAVGAVPYAGSPNDGSRLATVECLVDYHTLAIDESIFVRVPPRTAPPHCLPYRLDYYYLPDYGTVDKLRVHGRFYSDKPPAPALYLAGFYQALQGAFGLQARTRADVFCYLMTLASSGVAYVVAVWAVWRLGRALRLSVGMSLGLAASLGLSTVALTYTRHVNSHIQSLAVAAVLFACLASWEERPLWSAWRLLALGTLAGLAYAIEQPTGSLLLAGTLAVALVRPQTRRIQAAGIYLAAALPWAALHHALIYSFAGTLRPIGAIPEFFDYPGSEFHAGNLTGLWNHAGVADFLGYARALLMGERGFLQANLPLWLALLAVVLLGRTESRRPLVLLACGCCVGTWLIYAALSTNLAGVCCSVRWFVPLLAPAYYLLALLLRDRPFRADFAVLSAWGAVLAALMWYHGPWYPTPPLFWPIQWAALASWALCWTWRWWRSKPSPAPA